MATGTTVTFDPSASTDTVDPAAVEVQFSWGDGTASSSWAPYTTKQTHSFSVPGTYRVAMKVRADTRAGSDSNLSITVASRPAPVAYRKFSVYSYTRGKTVTVTVSATPGSGATSYSIEDTIPAGWAVSQISDSGEYDTVTGKVKWGPFYDSTRRSVTYVLTAPSDAYGTVAFSGIMSVDGSNTDTQGWLTISPGS